MASDTAWPAVTWEELTWRSNIPVDLLSHSAAERMRDPYLAAVTPEIADLEVRLPRSTAAAAEEASALIRDFDVEVGGERAPFAAILLRSEAASSSDREPHLRRQADRAGRAWRGRPLQRHRHRGQRRRDACRSRPVAHRGRRLDLGDAPSVARSHRA